MTLAIVILMVAGSLLTGCGGGGGGRLKTGGIAPGPSKPPPKVPPTRDVPVDQALVAAAKQEIKALLQSDLPSDRAHAIETYRTSMPEEAAGPISDGLDSRSQIVRFAAAMAAGELKLQSLKPKLNAHLNDPDPKVRVAVRYALHCLGDTSHSHELENSALDFNSGGPQVAGAFVRGATAMVLGRLNEPTVGNILRALRSDASPIVRQQAEEALFLHKDERARGAIIGFLSSRHPDDQMFALLALANARDRQYRAHAYGRLTSDYPDVDLVAARALGEMNADDGYGVAVIGAKSGEKRQRSLAAQAFGAIGRTDAQEYLAALLKDKESEVRAAAAAAILRIAREPRRYDQNGNLLR